MVWSSINTGGVILTPPFLLCGVSAWRIIKEYYKLIDHSNSLKLPLAQVVGRASDRDATSSLPQRM